MTHSIIEAADIAPWDNHNVYFRSSTSAHHYLGPLHIWTISVPEPCSPVLTGPVPSLRAAPHR
ncbi:hypothetical protein CGRA01v4_09104 [Colletotrichum graminicola]|nr:hypothetical protein CGRA01v4_09104 [Colletotrichum graminicola]